MLLNEHGDGWVRWSFVAAMTAIALFLTTLLILSLYDQFKPAMPSKGLGDAPIGAIHSAKRQCWESPNLFMNVCGYCVGVNGAYVHTRNAAIVIIADDPNCRPGGIFSTESIPVTGVIGTGDEG